jgi:integrase/recombinase XerD
LRRPGWKTAWPRRRWTAIAPTSAGWACGWPTTHEPLLDIRETTLTAFIAHLAKKTRATSQARYLSTAPLLPLASRPRPNRGRSDAQAGQPQPPVAPAQGHVGKTGGSPARCPRPRRPARPARPCHAGNLYATGLRVSELVNLKLHEVSLADGVLRALGKGSKERLVPLGQLAIDWIQRYLNESRPDILKAS